MEGAVSALLKMGRNYGRVACRCEIKGWTLKYDKPDLNLMWNEKTLAEISQKGNSLVWVDTRWCFVVFGGKLCLLERRAVFMLMHSHFGEWLQPLVWAFWRCRRKRSTCVFWWNTVYIYISLYAYLHIPTCFCVITLLEAWTSMSPVKGLVVMKGELFSWSPSSMHSKAPQMEAFTPPHPLLWFSRDLLNSLTCWGPAVPPFSLAPAEAEQGGLSDSASAANSWERNKLISWWLEVRNHPGEIQS